MTLAVAESLTANSSSEEKAHCYQTTQTLVMRGTASNVSIKYPSIASTNIQPTITTRLHKNQGHRKHALTPVK